MKTQNLLTGLSLLFALCLFAYPSFATLGVVTTSPLESSNLLLNQSVQQIFTITLNDTTNVNYQWLINNEVRQSNSNPVFTFTPTTLGPLNVTVNATQSTTNLTTIFQWNSTVIDPSIGLGLSGPAILFLGDDSQRASNGNSNKEELVDAFVERSFTLTNNNPIALNNIAYTITPVNGFSQTTDINMSLALPKVNLTAGESIQPLLRSRVPDRLDAINVTSKDIVETSFQVARVTITGTLSNGSQATYAFPVNIQRKNNLIIKDLDVCVETDCQDVGSDSKVDNIKPGDNIEIRVQIENLFSTNDGEDLDLEDIELTYEIDDTNFNEDDTEDIGSVSARSEDNHIFELAIPDDIDSGVYKVMLRATGTDENGGLHGAQQDFFLDIQRKSHDISIKSVTVNPSTFSCSRSDRLVRLTIDSQNVGRSDEEETVVTVRNSQFDLDRTIGPFFLSEDSKRTDTVSFSLPTDVQPGSYNLIVKSFFDTDKQTDEEGISFAVESCPDEKESSSTGSTDAQNTSSAQTSAQQTQTSQQPLSTSPVNQPFAQPTAASETSKKSSLAPSLVVVLLFALVLFAIAGVVLLIILRLR